MDEIQSIEDIQASILKNDPLEEYFFAPMRKKRVTSLRESYKQLYDMIPIQGNVIRPGKYGCRLILQGIDQEKERE